MKLKLAILVLIFSAFSLNAQNADKFVSYSPTSDDFALVQNGSAVTIFVGASEKEGVKMAAENLKNDLYQVSGSRADIQSQTQNIKSKLIIIGTIGSATIRDLIEKGKLNRADLEAKREKFLIQTIENPYDGVEKAIVIAGSDMRGTIYGIYELSQQIGVSPWYYWADVPVRKSENLFVKKGKYTAGEPAVRYRGIFLNDEAPALSGWSKATFGGFNHQFYEKVFELILRLKGNFLWPAMWGNAFYDDDPENGI